MRCSIVIPTFNHAPYLRRTLASIFAQSPPFHTEVVVVDDGSTEETGDVLGEFIVGPRSDTMPIMLHIITLPEKSEFRNPAKAINVGYKAATGDIVIHQSDDVAHGAIDTIEQLCGALREGEFVNAAVRSSIAVDGLKPHEWPLGNADVPPDYQSWIIHSRFRPAPYLFLGALWRKDIYAVGGYDDRFVAPGWSDNWFADCLIRGLKLTPIFRDDIIGYHQQHDRARQGSLSPSQSLYSTLVGIGDFWTETAPWSMEASRC